jgi:hypothetical protein
MGLTPCVNGACEEIIGPSAVNVVWRGERTLMAIPQTRRMRSSVSQHRHLCIDPVPTLLSWVNRPAICRWHNPMERWGLRAAQITSSFNAGAFMVSALSKEDRRLLGDIRRQIHRRKNRRHFDFRIGWHKCTPQFLHCILNESV